MRRPIALLALAAGLALAGAATSVLAADITVGLNESRAIGLGGEAATVVIGDPAVADVAMSDAHSVILVGRRFGTTRILVTDHHGHPLLDGRVAVVSPDAGHVTMFHGVTPSEFTCAGGRCHPADPSGSGPASPPPGAAEAASPVTSGPVAPISGQPIQPSPGL
jgi:hypothetical protein